MSLTENERAEVAKAIDDIDKHAAEMVLLLRQYHLPRLAQFYSATIASRLGVIDRAVRKS